MVGEMSCCSREVVKIQVRRLAFASYYVASGEK
jgi:hypothetical protein